RSTRRGASAKRRPWPFEARSSGTSGRQMRLGGGRRNSTVAQAWPSVAGHSEILGQGGLKPRPRAVAAAKIPALSGGELNLAISEKETRREREPASFRPPGPP